MKAHKSVRHSQERPCSRCSMRSSTLSHRWCQPCQNTYHREWRARQVVARVARQVKSNPVRIAPGGHLLPRIPDSTETVALFPKHRGESIGIQVVRFRDRWAVDIRIGYRHKTLGLYPTRRGVMFGARLLPRVIAALQQAQAVIGGQAASRGIPGSLIPAGFDAELWRRQYR